MSNETITIDSSLLARQVNEITGAVIATTATVGNMEERLCEAERDAADNITTNVNRGFYTLITSQIRQKMVQSQSVAEAQLLALRQSASSLMRIKKQMAADFQRISQRYSKLFEQLDNALRSRIYALDRPAAEISDADYETINRRVLMSGAPVAIAQQEMTTIESELAAVRCKRNCTNVLDGMKTLISRGIELSNALEAAKWEKSSESPKTYFVPVVISEATNLLVSDADVRVVAVPNDASLAEKLSSVRAECQEKRDAMVWSEPRRADAEAVRGRVIGLTQQENCNDRVREQILRMLEASTWEHLEGTK